MRGRSGGGGAVCERRIEGERKRGESVSCASIFCEFRGIFVPVYTKNKREKNI